MIEFEPATVAPSKFRSCYRSYCRRFKSGMRLLLSKKVEDRNKQEKE